MENDNIEYNIMYATVDGRKALKIKNFIATTVTIYIIGIKYYIKRKYTGGGYKMMCKQIIVHYGTTGLTQMYFDRDFVVENSRELVELIDIDDIQDIILNSELSKV